MIKEYVKAYKNFIIYNNKMRKFIFENFSENFSGTFRISDVEIDKEFGMICVHTVDLTNNFDYFELTMKEIDEKMIELNFKF